MTVSTDANRRNRNKEFYQAHKEARSQARREACDPTRRAAMKIRIDEALKAEVLRERRELDAELAEASA